MRHDLVEAGTRLAEVLDAENAALEALDLPRAAGMLAGKQQAMAAFAAAQAEPMVGMAAGREQVVVRLREVAQLNKALLERAIAVQGRVIGIVARSVASPSCYGAASVGGRGMRPIAFALAARV